MKNPANSSDPSVYRGWFRDMLWRAFPSASEHELASKAAPVLGVSERQVINWLRLDHDPKLRFVCALLPLAFGEYVFSRIEGQ